MGIKSTTYKQNYENVLNELMNLKQSFDKLEDVVDIYGIHYRSYARIKFDSKYFLIFINNIV